jgi:hypothetical protein
VRPFKGIICDDISEFESSLPSQAVRSLHARCGRARPPLISIWESNAEDDRPAEDARAIESLMKMTEELTRKIVASVKPRARCLSRRAAPRAHSRRGGGGTRQQGGDSG